MRAAVILLSFTFYLASVTSELPLNMIKKLMANMKQELLSKDIKSETMLEDLMMERSMVMESCEVQRHVLGKLRDLVMMSITQVKLCMAQSEQEEIAMKRYEYKHQPWTKGSDEVKVEKMW